MKRKTEIKKYEKPSLIRKKASTLSRRELIDYIVKRERVSKAKAQEIANNNELYQQCLTDKDKKVKMEMQDTTLSKIKEAVELKTERGSMEQAQKAMTAWAIGRDKVMGEDKYSKAINIGGKNVQINLGWKFKPYKSK